MEPGPPDDVSVSLGDVVVNSNRENRCSGHGGGVRRLWISRGSGQTQPVSVSKALQSQSPGLDLQRQEAEQQAQPRRQERTHSGAVEMHCPGGGSQTKIKLAKYISIYVYFKMRKKKSSEKSFGVCKC